MNKTKNDAITGNPELGVLRDDVRNLKGITMSAVVSGSVDIGYLNGGGGFNLLLLCSIYFSWLEKNLSDKTTPVVLPEVLPNPLNPIRLTVSGHGCDFEIYVKPLKLSGLGSRS